MKKNLIILGSVLAVALAIYFYMANKAVEVIEPSKNDLPFLTILTMDNTTLSLREVGNRSILIFFNPECDHCQREAKAISESKTAFKNYNLYFISIDPLPAIRQFATDYNLTDENFIFAQANGEEVYNKVGPLPSVPAIFIYNDLALVKKLEGEVKPEEIIKYLQ